MGQAVALEFPADLIEALQGDHFAVAGVEDGDGGVVLAASPVDAGDIGVSGLWLVVGRRRGGVGDASEDLAAVVDELGLVFGFPDVPGGFPPDAFEFVGVDEVGLSGAEVEGSPFILQGVEAVAVTFPVPVSSVGVLSK